MDRKIVVAVPVKDEEERIGNCLQALLDQTAPADEILLLLNNCTDASLEICRAAQRQAGCISIIEANLPPPRASAGEARRLALHEAASRAGDGVILTSDADAIVPFDWIEANLAALYAGADAVCGMARIDPDDARHIPAQLHRDHAAEAACLAALDYIDALIDPDPADPWPRHQQQSGASIAMTAEIFHRAGGAPCVASGEDRAMIEAIRLIDGQVRHDPSIVVTVSGRLEGRAAGGMADAIRRRMQMPDEFADDKLEPATDAYRRTLAKARLRLVRRFGAGTDALAGDLLLDVKTVALALREPCFGRAWAAVQQASPMLRRRRVACRDLARETRLAFALRDVLDEAVARREVLPAPYAESWPVAG